MRPDLSTMLPPLAALLMVAAPAPARAERPAFPATPIGARVAAYFEAYNADEAAMRAFFESNVGREELAARPIARRLGVWRDLREEHGRLTPTRVAVAGENAIDVVASAEFGPALALRFEFRDDAPHFLRSLMVEDTGGGDEGPPPPSGPPPGDAEIVASLGMELDSLARAGAFSGTVLLDKDGATLFAKAYGFSSRAGRRANGMETRFNLASINKSFTRVAILQLARQGKLRLDDTVDRWLPDYPEEAARRITIAMLLEHRGGVPDVLQSPALREHPERVRTHADWYARVREMPLRFEPGSRSEYSNGGYVMLGEIIARASGEDYYAYVRNHIYAPAGMTRSDWYAKDERVDDCAVPYSRRGRGPDAGGDDLEDARPGLPARGSAAGGGYSTAGDMVRYARALRAGTLLDAAGTAELLGPHPSLAIAGGSPGVNTMLMMQGPYTLVVLANLDPPAAERLSRTAGRMIRHADGAGEPGPGERRRVIRAGGGAR